MATICQFANGLKGAEHVVGQLQTNHLSRFAKAFLELVSAEQSIGIARDEFDVPSETSQLQTGLHDRVVFNVADQHMGRAVQWVHRVVKIGGTEDSKVVR